MRETREDPRSRTLKDRHLGGVLGELGQYLRSARAGADDRDATSRETLRVIPLGGVEARAGKRFDAVDLRAIRQVQSAEAADVYAKDRALQPVP